MGALLQYDVRQCIVIFNDGYLWKYVDKNTVIYSMYRIMRVYKYVNTNYVT